MPSAPDDPWARPKWQDQRTAALRLKRVLMTMLADRGVDLPIAPGGPVVRMVDPKFVREGLLRLHAGVGLPGAERTAPGPAVPCGTRLGRADAVDRRRGKSATSATSGWLALKSGRTKTHKPSTSSSNLAPPIGGSSTPKFDGPAPALQVAHYSVSWLIHPYLQRDNSFGL
jgi:hypothetical protein